MLLARFPRSLPLVFSLLAVSLPGATAPSWWSAPETRVLEPGGIPHDFSPATLGQLKFVATQAKKYLDLKLAAADGAGTAVNGVCQFSQVDNYAPVSLGQLKFIAKPFYDRLAAMHKRLPGGGYHSTQVVASPVRWFAGDNGVDPTDTRFPRWRSLFIRNDGAVVSDGVIQANDQN